MTDCSQMEAAAREKFYFLDTINEFNRLLNLGIFPGKERKSVQKLADHIEKLWHTTIAEIEANEWYKSELEAMQKLSIIDIMKNGEGQYDPEYKVQMPDIFRKKA